MRAGKRGHQGGAAAESGKASRMRLIIRLAAIGILLGAASDAPSPDPWSARRANDVVDAADDGMLCDGSTDDATALNHAIARALSGFGRTVQLPNGRCLLSRPITARLSGNQALHLAGHGPYATELVFDGAGGGLALTYASGATYVRDPAAGSTATGAAVEVSELSVVRAGVRAGTGMAGNGIAVLGDSANAGGAVMPHTILHNVVVRGTEAGGWSNALLLQDTANVRMEHVTALCMNSQNPLASNGNGLAFAAAAGRVATVLALDHFHTWGCNHGLDVSGHVEGVSVVGGNFTGGGTGIYWASEGRTEQLLVVNTSFSTLVQGIYAFNVQNVQIANSSFYNQNTYPNGGAPGGCGQANSAWNALTLSETDSLAITGNTVLGAGIIAGRPLCRTPYAETGIRITNDTALATGPVTITGNTFHGLNGPVMLARNATRNLLFSGNTASATLAPVPILLGGSGAFTGNVTIAGNLWNDVLYPLGYPGSPGLTVQAAGDTLALSGGNLSMAGGRIDAPTTSLAVGDAQVAGTLAAGLAANAGVFQLTGDLRAGYTPAGQGAIGFNDPAGTAAVGFFNNATGPSPKGFLWHQRNGGGGFDTLAGVTADGLFTVQRLRLATCPASAAGLSPGDLWCDGGDVVHRVP